MSFISTRINQMQHVVNTTSNKYIKRAAKKMKIYFLRLLRSNNTLFNKSKHDRH